MNEIVISDTNGLLTVSSVQLAKDFGKQHKHVLDTIGKLKAENSAVTSMFIESTYKAGTGKAYKAYDITRDGFSLLVMGFTGKKALEWKLKYIEAFNAMEHKLRDGLPDIEEIVQRAVNTAVSETVKALTENNNNTPLLSEPPKIPKNWRKATHRLIQRIAMEYDENTRDIYNQIYSELEERTGCNLYAKLDSLYDRLSDEGTPYKVLESLNNIDVIASDEKLTRVYLSIVKEMAIECGV